MSVEPDHKALATSAEAGADPQQSAADAVAMVEALETAAASLQTPSREALELARHLLGELRTLCEGRADRKALILRGQSAVRLIRSACYPNMAPAPVQPAGEADAQPAPDERDADFGQNVDRMRRIVAALEAASRTEEPSQFVEQARLCRQIWDEIGPAGPEGPALTEAYHKATALFWAKAGVPEDDTRAR